MMINSRTISITKWLATILVITATAFNSLGYYPIGPIINTFAGLLWCAVSIAWNDKALMVTNFTITFVCIAGLAFNFGAV